MHFLTTIDRALAKVEEVLLALLLIGLVVLAATQVLLRNVWSTSIDWADLTLQNATVLIGLLGAAVATSEGRHLNIDVFGRKLSGRSAFLLRVVIGVFGVVICTLLTRGGWETFVANYIPWKANLPTGWSVAKMLRQELAEGSFPQWLSQVLLPIGFALIGTHFVLRLLRDIGSLVTGTAWEGDEAKDLQGDAYLDELVRNAEEGEREQVGGEEHGDDALDCRRVELPPRQEVPEDRPSDAYDSAAEPNAPEDEDPEEETFDGRATLIDDRNDTLVPPLETKDDNTSTDDEDEPEEALTEFEPRLQREMGRVVREQHEEEASKGFDQVSGEMPVVVSPEKARALGDAAKTRDHAAEAKGEDRPKDGASDEEGSR